MHHVEYGWVVDFYQTQLQAFDSWLQCHIQKVVTLRIFFNRVGFYVLLDPVFFQRRLPDQGFILPLNLFLKVICVWFLVVLIVVVAVLD